MPEVDVIWALEAEVHGNATKPRSVVTFGHAKPWRALSRPWSDDPESKDGIGLQPAILATLSYTFEHRKLWLQVLYFLSPNLVIESGESEKTAL